ncbi:glycosyltransferase family 2 protein [Halosquirtibacter laminarini]|uniref:Glycosyltransferase family 2 protein n=1 Tax=Halosquirtibacter laminarini TaxID=3374600 RepID=A0AC61NKZ7_9BACT|nr:glycosyltransferase family 2 protein [Prolixibacteraceae bacterium]
MSSISPNPLTVAVVILNWNGEALLKTYLPDLVANTTYPNARLIVADNGSTDQSFDVVESIPEIEWLPLEKNYGFADGYNRCLQQIEVDIYILMNSDIRASKGWLEPLIHTFEKDKSIAIQQPKIMDDKKHDFFEYAGASGGYIDTMGYPFCRGRIMDHLEKDDHQYDDLKQVFWASGACFAIRSSMWHRLGGFDTIFWAHMEEIDLCWRANNLGGNVYVNPASKVYHLGGGSLPYGNPKKTYLNFRNNLILLSRNLHKSERFTTLLKRMILDGVASMVFILKGEFNLVPQVLKAHRDFYRSKSKIQKYRKGKEFKKRSELPIYQGCIPLLSSLCSIRKYSQLKHH